MDVGIGLPNTVRVTQGAQLLEWAKRADEAGFSSLGTIDRIVYRNHEPLLSLAAAAAVTERIRLATTILLAPTRGSGELLGKQAATIQSISRWAPGGGRRSWGTRGRLRGGGRRVQLSRTAVQPDAR